MTALFEDEGQGGYYLTASDAERLIVRPKETYDGAVPSGNAVAAMVLQKLALLSGQLSWQEAAHRQFCFLAGQIRQYPAGHSFALLAMTWALYPHQELVCATAEGVPAELQAYLQKQRTGHLSLLLKNRENEQQLAQWAPFTKAYPVPEQGAMYYLCEEGACRAPVADLQKLQL